MKKKIIALLIVVVAILSTGCGNKQKVEEDLLGVNFDVKGNEAKLDFGDENPVVALYIENYGAVVMELYPDIAPNTVNNFITLVKDGFYNDNTFHRLMPGFVLQGGDPTGTGMGGPDYGIKGEFSSNGIENSLAHTRGVVSMARALSYDSGGSQFFILLGDAGFLDGDYAAFGKVIAGMDIVDRIEKTEKIKDADSGTLQNILTIKKALVDTKGYEVGEVEKVSR